MADAAARAGKEAESWGIKMAGSRLQSPPTGWQLSNAVLARTGHNKNITYKLHARDSPAAPIDGEYLAEMDDVSKALAVQAYREW